MVDTKRESINIKGHQFGIMAEMLDWTAGEDELLKYLEEEARIARKRFKALYGNHYKENSNHQPDG